MNKFNLSDWALRHRSLVWYFMLAFMAAGFVAYLQLGREEDPAFTIKTMVIQAQWPGASPEEITRQVTDRIEKKLEELEVAGLHQKCNCCGPNHCIRLPARQHQSRQRRANVGSRAQYDCGYQSGFPARRYRAVFQ